MQIAIAQWSSGTNVWNPRDVVNATHNRVRTATLAHHFRWLLVHNSTRCSHVGQHERTSFVFQISKRYNYISQHAWKSSFVINLFPRIYHHVRDHPIRKVVFDETVSVVDAPQQTELRLG